MIKTKSIREPKSKDDGTRICVMRFIKSFYDYDEWLRDLAPSLDLLNTYNKKNISWSGYEKIYLEQMKGQQKLIDELRKRSKAGEVITLLCWEDSDKFCHRRLLKSLIENRRLI